MIRIKNLHEWILPIFINLTLFNGFIKALSGVRYFPIIIDLFLLLLILAFLYTRKFTQLHKIGMIDVLVVLFMGVASLNMFHPNIPSIQAGVEGFRKFYFMLVGIFIGRYLITKTSLKILIRLLLITSIIISIYGIKQYLFPTPLDFRLIQMSTASPVTYMMGGHIRSFSTMSGPFHLGVFLMSILLLLFSIWLQYQNNRILFLFISIPFLLALIMTVTKSNWFGLIGGGIFLGLINSKNPLRLIKKSLLLSLIGVGSFLFLFQLSSSYPLFQTIYAGLQAFKNPLEAPTMLIRFDLWRDKFLPMIYESPWIGYGTGSAGEGLANLFTSDSSKFINAHNIFFKVQFEQGLIGLIIFVIFLIYIFNLMWRQRKKIQNSFLKIISNWSLAFFVSIIITGIVGSILDAYPVNLLFWIILGSSTRLYNLEKLELENTQIREINPKAINEN
jgi:O-antigen ligase